jgi:hypothetical protein
MASEPAVKETAPVALSRFEAASVPPASRAGLAHRQDERALPACDGAGAVGDGDGWTAVLASPSRSVIS